MENAGAGGTASRPAPSPIAYVMRSQSTIQDQTSRLQSTLEGLKCVEQERDQEIASLSSLLEQLRQKRNKGKAEGARAGGGLGWGWPCPGDLHGALALDAGLMLLCFLAFCR